MTTAELSGVTVISAGSFNPAIVHPRWLAEKGLIPNSLAEDATRQDSAQPLLVSPQVAVFVADWLTVQVTQEQALFSTVDQGRELDLRDFVRGLFDLLPETPVDAVGINSDTHFRAPSEEAWHAFGDRFLPKDFWEPLFDSGSWIKRPDGQHVGMRVMTVEAHRDDKEVPGFVGIEVAPSVRITPHGVYVGINYHLQLRRGDERSNAGDASEVVTKHWEDARSVERRVVASLLEAI